MLLWPCLLRRSPGPDEDIIQPTLHRRGEGASANSADRDIMWLHHCAAGESHMKTDWGEVLDGEIMRAPVNLADGMLRLHDTPSSVNAHSDT